MDQLFLSIVNMSVTATWIALAVILLRPLLKKAPKWITVAMWGLVAARLIIPFAPESSVSLIPSAETIPQDIVYSTAPEIDSGIFVVNSVVNPVIADSFTPTELGASVNPIQIFLFFVENVWVLGAVAMLIYAAISYLVIYRKVREATPLFDNVWLCDRISSPFILGVVRPRIYVPSGIAKEDLEFVLAHERAHLTRRDHWWKPLGFLLLTVHWFNPVMWVAYVLLCRDIELACDEKVVRAMGTEVKKPYSDALINCSAKRSSITACPLAFGEVGVKTRIKTVLSYKKPAFWVIIIAAVLCVAVAVVFLTNPKTTVDDRLAVLIDCQIAEHNQSPSSTGVFSCTAWDILEIQEAGNRTTVYMWALYHEYSLGEDGEPKLESGSHMPVAVTAEKHNGEYYLIEYWTPRDGTYWASDIMDKFPARIWKEATNSQRYIGSQKAKCEQMAKEYFDSLPDIETDTGKIDFSPSESDIGGVSIEVTSIEMISVDVPEIRVTWTNDSKKSIAFGEEFYIYRLVEGEWVDCRTTDNYAWDCAEYVCLPMQHVTYGYPLIDIDLTDGGTYRFETKFLVEEDSANHTVWMDFVIPDIEGNYNSTPNYLVSHYIDTLKEKYPQYFGLGTAKGLEVYWYQMSASGFSWVVLPGKNMNYTWEDIIELPPTTTTEMRAIVSSYGLDRTMVAVSYMPMPHSSYMVPDSPEYRARIEEMFWYYTVPLDNSVYTVPSYGSLVFDIDGDGLDEIVSLGYGMTSGVFSFSMTATYNGERKYYDTFTSPYCEPQFLVRSHDDVCVMIKAQAEKGQAEVAVLYEISVEDGHIVLTASKEAEDYFLIRRLPVKSPID